MKWSSNKIVHGNEHAAAVTPADQSNPADITGDPNYNDFNGPDEAVVDPKEAAQRLKA